MPQRPLTPAPQEAPPRRRYRPLSLRAPSHGEPATSLPTTRLLLRESGPKRDELTERERLVAQRLPLFAWSILGTHAAIALPPLHLGVGLGFLAVVTGSECRPDGSQP